MDLKTFHGVWWLPDDNADRQPGVLTIDPTGKATLELIGGFDLSVRMPIEGGGFSLEFAHTPLPVIHGEADGKILSLIDGLAMETKGTRGFFWGPPSFQRFHVHRALLGAHVESVAEPRFQAAYMRFENLATWVHPIIRASSNLSEGTAEAHLTRAEPLEATFEGWMFEVTSACTTSRCTRDETPSRWLPMPRRF